MGFKFLFEFKYFNKSSIPYLDEATVPLIPSSANINVPKILLLFMNSSNSG